MYHILQSSHQLSHQFSNQSGEQSVPQAILSLGRSLRSSPKKQLVFLIGIPGSGKSGWAKYFYEALGETGVSIVSPDAIRQQLFGAVEIQGSWVTIWQQAVREIRQALDLGKLIVYDATNTQYCYRRQTLACLRALGCGQITGIWLDFPLELCLQRNQQRDRQVPETVIKNMYQDLQLTPPSLADGLDCLQHYILVDQGVMVRRR